MSAANQQVIEYRKIRAFATYKEAKVLAESGSWNGAANRFYACFYMVSALLLKNGYITKTHAGTKNFFLKEFVKTNRVHSQHGRFYQNLFELRTEGDYEDLVIFDEEEVKPLIGATEDFLNELNIILDSK